jgi:hypothetical protein
MVKKKKPLGFEGTMGADNRLYPIRNKLVVKDEGTPVKYCPANAFVKKRTVVSQK